MSLVRANALAIPLADESVDLIVTSPPYFALRSYTDGGEHYDGQIGSEDSPQAFLEALWAVTRECVRVLKPTGSLWVNLGDKYAGSGGHNNSGVGGSGRGPTTYNKSAKVGRAAQASRDGVRHKSLMGLPWRYTLGCIDQLDLILRAEVVWSKPNGLPELVTDRVRRSHEQWFHLTKQGQYFAAVDEIREPSDPAKNLHPSDACGPGHRDMVKRGLGHGTVGHPGKPLEFNPLGKLPGSVWTIPTEPLTVPELLGVDHFAAFPQEFPRRIILGWSPSAYCTTCDEPRRKVPTSMQRPTSYVDRCACPDTCATTRPAVVLDPFGGTGTTAMVARALGRYPVHIDLSRDYLRLAHWRIYESGHWRKSADRTRNTGTNVPDIRPLHEAHAAPSLFDPPARAQEATP